MREFRKSPLRIDRHPADPLLGRVDGAREPEDVTVSYYPHIFRNAKDTPASTRVWIVLGIALAAIAFFSLRDFGDEYLVVLKPPEGATVRVDGEPVEPPYWVWLEPGEHAVEVTTRGKRTPVFSVEVNAEQSAQVFIVDGDGLRRL